MTKPLITPQASSRGESAAESAVYLCPGERHSISRAVHLSRMAAGYSGCRDCPHRHDSGQLSQQMVRRLETTARRAEPEEMWVREGVRGVYLNDLTRKRAEQLAAAIASLLWEQKPHVAREISVRTSAPRVRRRGPTIVVGHDERPSSPDLVTGVATSLRRMGCQVIDVGCVGKPCFLFAVEHLNAAAGMYVTGQGYGPSWMGLDVVGEGALPWSRPGLLDQAAARAEQSIPRPTRTGGTQRTFQATVPYEAGLWKFFHALRPLRVGIACGSPLVTPVLERLFRQLPCELHWVDWTTCPQQGQFFPDAVLGRLGDFVHESRLHFGMAIAGDGQAARLVDECGDEIPADCVVAAFAELLGEEREVVPLVVANSPAESLRSALDAARFPIVSVGRTHEQLVRALRQNAALLGADGEGRYWFRDAGPLCDGVLTLAQTLQFLSRSDRPASAAFAVRPAAVR